MQVALLEERGRIVTRESDDLAVGPGDVLIRVTYAGVCGSDLHTFKGQHPFRTPPVVLGHEVAGVVAEVGPGVVDFAPGDRVTVLPNLACGACLYCRRGQPNICVNKRVPGIKGWVGTFAEYFLSRPEITFQVSEGTSLKVATLAEPLAVGIHSARQARVGQGERVLVLGGGSIGLLTAYAARMAGAASVALTDLYDYNLRMAEALGCAHTYNARSEALDEVIRRDYPEGFEAILLTSGAPSTVEQALRLAQRGGRIVITGLVLQPVTLKLTDVTLNEIELIGSQIYTADDFTQALRWLDEQGALLGRLIDHVLPLDRAQEALQIMAERREDAIKILLAPGDGEA